MTTQLLNVLLVEDSEDDALLTLRELQKGGVQARWERVDTRAGMERALTERAWDLVICDHLMPGFSSAGALDVMRKLALDLPFIIVSGAAPEDLVTAAMRQGAHDFIAKGNLIRLVPAVRRELKEADLRRDRRAMQSRLAEKEVELERRLRQVQKVDALGQLAAGIAHDFNDVLTTILAAAEFIKGKTAGDSPLLPKVEAILHAGLSAAGLTRQLLGFSRKADGKRIPLDLAAAVRDTGCGMDPSVQERMFEPFFTTRAVGEGTGLGLSMVHATVAKAGGSISVQSAAGQGTSIRIQLPGASGLEPPREAAAGPAAAPAAAGAKRILLAEDSHTTRAMIRAWLERAGCQVHEARDGLEAWDLFTASAFDLLLTDVVMPRMDGLELSRLVRKADPALPIALLTASDDQETTKAALNLGINRFLAKPFPQAELIACVEQLLTERSTRLDARRSLETARAVRQAQRSMAAAPEKGVPLFTLYEPLTDAGGDVFRCFRCSDGSILFVLADVAGHSVSSSYAVASFLGMLSTFVGECYGLMALAPNQESCEAQLPCSVHGCGRFGRGACDPLPHLAAKLNHAIQSGPFAEVPVCVLLGHWTPATGRLQLLNAGIPHALHSRSGSGRTGPVRINGTPLGIFPETDLEGCVLQLEPGDRILCGTDGFFEVLSPAGRPFQDTATGRWETLAGAPLDLALAEICEAARNHGGGLIADDLLVVGFEQPALARAEDELVLRLPSTPRAVDMACDRLQGSLKAAAGRWDLRQERRFDILLAVREALTNAVLHGNGNRPGSTVTLRCRPDPGCRSLVVSVADEGPGFDLEAHRAPEDPLSERGRGIPIIRHHAQELRMVGNELTMTFRLEELSHDPC